MDISIKREHKKTAIAFGNSGLPLGERTEQELIDLGILARQSNDRTLLSLFEVLPKIEELQKEKTDTELKSIRAKQDK